MLNFYRRFIPQAASIQARLHAALAGPKVRGEQPVDWTPTMVLAFEDCKASLFRATLLAHPDPFATLGLFTETSDICIGAVLQQHVYDARQPLAFYSDKLSPAQQMTIRTTASSWQCMRPSRTSDIWLKAVHLSFLRITNLSFMLSSNAEINAHHDSFVTCSLLDNSLLTSGMSQRKTVLYQTPYRERTPS
jgi:hypothetical protein